MKKLARLFELIGLDKKAFELELMATHVQADDLSFFETTILSDEENSDDSEEDRLNDLLEF